MKFRKSFRQHLLLAASCGVLASGAGADRAWGQLAPTPQPPQSPTATEEVVVTGSRLKESNATSENPVTTISAAEIAKSSAQTVEQILQKLPAIGASGLYATTNNGGQGASCTDIRNLGFSRTLVLVNGRRFVHSGIFGDDCVDLNNIPLELIDHIDILKDGASAIYGADAVAGVINIILKTTYNGTVVHADGLLAQAGGDRTGQLSFTTGHNFDQGNVTISLDYDNQGPVPQKDRNWAVPVIASTSTKGNIAIGSGIPPAGRIFNDSNSSQGGYTGLSGPDLIALGNGKTAPYSRTLNAYDYGQEQYLQGSLEKWGFTGLGHYDINEFITAYAETYFTHKSTVTQLAAQPVTGGLNATLPDAFVVPQGNPYLQQIGGPDQGPVDLYRRVAEFGDRSNTNVTNTYQVNTGLKGALPYDWNYDVFFQYGRSDSTISTANEVNFARLEQEVGFVHDTTAMANPGDPGPNIVDATTYGHYDPTICTNTPGCVLINPFGPNSISKAGIDYARFTEVANSSFTLRTFGGNLTNDDVFDLPFGPLGVSVGAEHRRESGFYEPDTLVASGVTLENSQQPTSGSFNTTEVYGETRIPILKDLPFAKDLHVDLGGRFYDYNTFGTGETWKTGFNYTPVTGIRFRGSIGDAFRQPSINELYGGQALSFNTASDPCAGVSTYGGKAAAVAAKCASQIPGYNSATFAQLGNGQVQTITGGNPNLLPETARTETIGLVISPPFIPTLNITADYWHTKIENSVGSLDTQDILDGCYTGVNPQFCSLIAPRAAQAQLSTVTAINENLGVTRTSGVDIGASYTYTLPAYGSITANDDFALLLNYLQQNVPNGPFINYAGLQQLSGATPTAQPLHRNVFNIEWNFDDFSVGYQNRFIGHMGLYPESSYTAGVQLATGAPYVDYSDVHLSYIHANLQVTFGIDNIANKAPPFLPDGATNTNVSVYDVLGRVFYLKSSYKFGAPPPPPPPLPEAVAPPPAPAIPVARTYLVFFDWDRSDLSARAKEIVSAAAQASTHVQTTRIEVDGYTDLSGTAGYNQKLSVRRAQTVENELIRDGVPATEIAIHGYGESNPLVPTAKGVREPQNRRVEIILK
jgi:outer membrane receptor protein involved in Fe transport